MVVVIEGAAQPGAHLDDVSGVVVVGRSGTVGQELATNALVIAFGVVVGDIFTNEMSKVSLAEDNEVIKALGSDGLDETFSVRVAVGASSRDGDAFDAGTV